MNIEVAAKHFCPLRSLLLCHSFQCPAYTWTQRAFSAEIIQVAKGKGFGLAERPDQTYFDQNSGLQMGRTILCFHQIRALVYIVCPTFLRMIQMLKKSMQML